MSDRRPVTILVVDDNPATLYATSRFLRAAGFTIVEANTGTDALEMAENGPDVVVLDVNLPDIDGFEVCRRLRAKEKTSRIPIIHLSATFAADVDKVQGLNAGADGYLTHPVEPPVLVATVNAFLRARHAEEGMRRSEEKFRAIFDQALNGITLISQELIYIEVNPAMCQMLGRDRADVVGKHLSAFLPRDAEDQIAVVGRELATHSQWRGTVPHLRADGGIVELDWNISAHSTPGMRLAMVTDITERRARDAERERLLLSERAARAEAERANRLKDEFLATLSHELRTPLTAIVGWSQILKGDTTTPQDIREGIESIERNAKAQANLISDLLDVSRITSGKMRLDLEPVDPAQLIRMALEGVTPAASAKGITIEQDLESHAGLISADAGRLQQIIWNLGHNAAKFTPSGGRITVRLRRIQSEIKICIIDTGQGISPEFLPHIFERFRQEDGTTRRNHGGLGLGLAIVKHLVEMHGGRVTADSKGEGQGATFCVFLPILGISQPDTERTEDTSTKAVPATAYHSRTLLDGLRVLIVDDDDDSRILIGRILKDFNANVSEAATVEEALNMLESFSPAVLVSDIGMPLRDGYDLIRDVRARGFTAEKLPAIALTAFARPEDHKQSLFAGFQIHLAKPVDTNQLIGTIAMLVGRDKN